MKAEDLIAFGFESEFIGRLPVTAVFERLEVEDLYSILKNPNNPIVLGKKKDFKSYGIDIQFEDEALHDLAVKAGEEKTGARGLVSAVEKVLLKFEKRIPSTSIRKLVVTKAVVENPKRELERLLQDPSRPEMMARFDRLVSQEKKALEGIDPGQGIRVQKTLRDRFARTQGGSHRPADYRERARREHRL